MQTSATQPNYEIRVGMFAIIALIMLFYGWGWLKSMSLFHPPQRFTVQFHDVAGLNKNATVNINGVRVGVIESIELKAAGKVLVHPKITAENVVVPKGSRFTIQTLGLVGAKYMEVTLPEVSPGESEPPALQEHEIVIGEDPVRIELVLNEVGSFARAIVTGMKGEHIGKNIGVALRNIKDAAGKFNKDLDTFNTAAISVGRAGDRVSVIVDKFGGTSANAERFFAEGSKGFRSINELATEVRGTNRKVKEILDRPLFSSDLKDIVDKAKAISDQLSVTAHEVTTSLKDPATRADLKEMLDRFARSSDNIARSVESINKIAGDQQLRTDVKETIINAREAIDKASAIINSPGFAGDLRNTLSKARTAAVDVDIAARQLQQILDKRAPLLQMLIGRPGKREDLQLPPNMCPDPAVQTPPSTNP